MSRQKVTPKRPSTTPDKDEYTGGSPRPEPNSSPRGKQSENRPQRDAPAASRAGDGGPNEGKWKAEDVPPFAKTYREPLDEEGNEE